MKDNLSVKSVNPEMLLVLLGKNQNVSFLKVKYQNFAS